MKEKNKLEIYYNNKLKQPELKTKFIFPNRKYPVDLINRGICGKLITKQLFNKILRDIGKQYTEDYIDFAEDTIMVISLLHLAKSYYLMKELGYYYSFDEKRNYFPKLKEKVCKPTNKIKDFSFFKFLSFLVGKTENNEKEQLMAYQEITTNIDYNYFFKSFNMSKEHYEILFYIFDKSLNFGFLKKEQKKYIMQLKIKAIQKKNKNKIL